MKVSQTDPYSVATRGHLMRWSHSSQRKMPQECPISFLLRGFAAQADSGRDLAIFLVAVTE
jgi:hypothetical protein